MSNLPPEIIAEILHRLPVKSLLRFTCVSKWWYALIHSPDFINIHLNHSIKTNNERTLIIVEEKVLLEGFYTARFHDDDWFGKAVIGYLPLKRPNVIIDIIGSCNGVVCISTYPGEEIAIWNTLIRKYKKLPVEPIEYPSGFGKYLAPLYGFGHDPVNDDYKVMRIVRFSNAADDDCAFEVKVYSLREHSWKRIVQEWPKEFSLFDSPMAFFNGAFYGLVGRESNRHSESLLAFDLASETFRMYTTPVQPKDDGRIGLKVLGGKLCLCVHKFDTLKLNAVFFWVMEEYGVVSSWTRLYTIEQGAERMLWPMAFSKDGKRVLLQQDWRNLIWNDVKEKQGRKVTFCNMPDSFQMAICVGSLVLIDGDILIDPREEEKRNEQEE